MTYYKTQHDRLIQRLAAAVQRYDQACTAFRRYNDHLQSQHNCTDQDFEKWVGLRRRFGYAPMWVQGWARALGRHMLDK